MFTGSAKAAFGKVASHHVQELRGSSRAVAENGRLYTLRSPTTWFGAPHCVEDTPWVAISWWTLPGAGSAQLKGEHLDLSEGDARVLADPWQRQQHLPALLPGQLPKFHRVLLEPDLDQSRATRALVLRHLRLCRAVAGLIHDPLLHHAGCRRSAWGQGRSDAGPEAARMAR